MATSSNLWSGAERRFLPPRRIPGKPVAQDCLEASFLKWNEAFLSKRQPFSGGEFPVPDRPYPGGCRICGFLPLQVFSKAGKTAPFLRILFHGIIINNLLKSQQNNGFVIILQKNGRDHRDVG
jgi:hypothetical protein